MADRALVVIDMLSTYEHADAETLRENIRAVLPTITELVEKANDAGAPVIYVNDSFGDWRSDRTGFIDSLLEGEHGDLVKPLFPAEDALFITKARHSIFYQTPLEYLLRQEGIETIVLTGQVTEQCVLYSALDAHIRHLQAIIPRDGVAHIHQHLADAALEMMELNMTTEVCDADEISF